MCFVETLIYFFVKTKCFKRVKNQPMSCFLVLFPVCGRSRQVQIYGHKQNRNINTDTNPPDFMIFVLNLRGKVHQSCLKVTKR